MEFSVKRLIPSLFPSMILSSIAISNSKGKDFKKSTSLFGVQKSIFRLTVCSLLSGYIIGPKMLCEDDTDEDKTRYIALTSNAGLGYVVSFVGIAVCGSLCFGIFLYFTQVFSALIIFKLQKNSVDKYKISSDKKPFIDTVSIAVKDTTHLIFEICGFYVFFSIIKTVFVSIFNLKSGAILYSFVASILEISNGIQGATTLENTALCAFFIGFSVGFGGICMCMQTFSVCNASLNKFKFTKIKLFQGVFCQVLRWKRTFCRLRLVQLFCLLWS